MAAGYIQKLRSLQRTGNLDEFSRLLTVEPYRSLANAPSVRLLRAVVAGLFERHSEMAALAAGLNEHDFQSSVDLADYALLRFLLGHRGEAEALLLECSVAKDADAFTFARLGTIKLLKNELDKAGENLLKALELEPHQPEFLSNLGGIRLREGRLDEALVCYERALAVRPEFPVAQQQRARVRIALGQAEDVLVEREEHLENNPHELDAYLRLAQVQSHLDRVSETEATLERAIERFPDERSPKIALVQELFQRRRWWQAGKRLLQWTEEDSDDIELRAMLNRARIEVGFLDAAESDLADWPEAQREAPNYPLIRARLLSERQRSEEAIEVLKEALGRFPGLVEARKQLVHLLNQLGRLSDARQHQDILASVAPGAAIEAIAAGNQEASEQDVELLRQIKDSPAVGREQRSQAAFGLARLFDRSQQYDAAFEALNDANALVGETITYDWRAHRRQVQAHLRVFTSELVERLGDAGHTSARPIFVLGMPRSGTTLTEQILASHPQVFGAGELGTVPRVSRLTRRVLGTRLQYPFTIPKLSAGQIRDAGRYYLDRVAEMENESDHVVDKLPHNFDHIGLIALMLPNAKIVHLRRDPRDVAVSNYFQNFGAKQGVMGFAFDLGDIGHMLNDHDRIVAHWHELFPGKIYDLSYEALVRDPETEIAKLLDHCGLPWDDRVMRFYETQRPVKTASVRQVREGIYTTSAEKWRRYERHLGPLEAALAEGFNPVGPPQGKAATPAAADAGTTAAGTAAAPDAGSTAPDRGRAS